MSTTQRELEELRQAREAARLQAQEEQRIAEENAAKQAKRDEFKKRAAAFTQTKSPTNEQIKEQVQKASQQRRFAQQLNKALKGTPSGVSPFAVEISLRGNATPMVSGMTAETDEADAMLMPPPPPPRQLIGLGTQKRPSITPPPPPPPLPTQSLLQALNIDPDAVEADDQGENGVDQQLDGADLSRDDIALEFAATFKLIDSQQIPVDTSVPHRLQWVLVPQSGEDPPYYWNMYTNDVTAEAPEGFDGTVYNEDILSLFHQQWLEDQQNAGTEFCVEEDANGSTAVEQVIWQVIKESEADGDGEPSCRYYNLTTSESQSERPEGTLYIRVFRPRQSASDLTGEEPDEKDQYVEEHWQECFDEDGRVYYAILANNTFEGIESTTDEQDPSVLSERILSSWECPVGDMYIIAQP